MKRNLWILAIFTLMIAGCDGFARGCRSDIARGFGADWIIVQYNYTGEPVLCWKLDDASVTNETNSDGIYWSHRGHLVHISGWYNRVQVSGGDWMTAANSVGVDMAHCNNGVYQVAAGQ